MNTNEVRKFRGGTTTLGLTQRLGSAARLLSDSGKPRSRRVAVLAMMLLFATATFAEFPMAGGNAQRTSFVDVDGPLTEPEILWERPLGIRGISNTQPVIDRDGNIYVTASPVNAKTWEGPDAPRVVLASFTPDGTERWRSIYTWDHRSPQFQGTWSQLSGPVISGDTVVIGHRYGVLRGIDRLSGKTLWSCDLSPGRNGITSTPVADREGYVYVHCRDIPTVQKIEAATGKVQWIHRFVDGEAGHTSSPTLSADEQTLYIGRSTSKQSYIYAMDTADGTHKWAWSPKDTREHSFAWPVPALGPDGTIYLQDEELAHLYAVRDAGHTYSFQWQHLRDGAGAPRFGAVSTHGYFGTYNAKAPEKAIVFHIDNRGNTKWETLLDNAPTGGVLVSRNGVYLSFAGFGLVQALSPDDGATLWHKQVGTPTGDCSEGLTLAKDGTLYIGVSGTPTYPEETCLVAFR